MSEHSQHDPAAPEYLTVADVAEMLSVSPRTIQHLIRTEQLPVHRIGRAVRIKRATLLDVIDRAAEKPLTGDPRPRRDGRSGRG